MLLVVVLALGVFVMHTVGHPHDSSAMGSATHAQVAAADTPPGVHELGDMLPVTDGSQATKPTRSPSTHSPFMPMDMLSLCMAVLVGAWVLAALVRSALSRRPDGLEGLLTTSPVRLWPNAPPGGPDLTRMSVLRL
ncbi:hypothetical protein [Streptomyces longwoodensis]|uniref:hypothetical protein n=1 Tax=Streptomyces longwoodensis TaxID=68231 RepID=UPI00340AC358